MNRTFKPESAHNARPSTWKALDRLIFDGANTWLTHANFWNYVNICNPDECWYWGGGQSRGYGRFKTDVRVSDSAHRVAFALYHRKNPEAMHVCHQCDTPLCVNPHHLFLGTAADNMQDMRSKGRGRSGDRSGEKNPRAKLNRADVRKIKKLICEGETNTSIAEVFGISHSTISAIRRGKAWGNVPLQPKYESLRTETP